MAESEPNSPSPKRGLWQWLWRGDELARARHSLRSVPTPRRQQLQRAQTALELAERALDPVDPLRAGSSLPLSLSLYREAAYWALAAQDSGEAPASLAGAFDKLPGDLLEFAAGGSEDLQNLRSSLVDKSFRETAADSAEQQRRDAQLADAFVKALIDRQLGPERRLGRALVQRWVRLTLSSLLLLLLGIGSTLLFSALTTGPNLAAGKPWRPSSSNDATFKAPRNEYFFHTQDEDNPWLELDLQKPTQFSLVEVVNRRDCCPDRALPAAIEVSGDRKHWKEVSRRTESFSVWQARFAPVTARYVRVRVLRRSILHLASVAVRAK